MSQSPREKYEVVIGLEVHTQLNTETKIFCSCANKFGEAPNALTCPVCLGLPGTLPVLNKKALEHAIKIALALNCHVNPYIKFDRKNYYYPDLPKGYQISQFDKPIASDGYLMVPLAEGEKKIRIKRAHLEEDAGKLIHDPDDAHSLVDYNRTGTPLVEIVTEPDLRSPEEAYHYLQLLKLTIQYLHVSDCDMEKGSLRCDANISIRPRGSDQLGTKTELKNLNSFKAVKASLEYEIDRQIQCVETNTPIVQETRLWDDHKGVTASMRSKEEAHDYRYFPEPDLVPFMVEQSEITHIQEAMPELPLEKKARLQNTYALTAYDADILIQDPAIADFFEHCAKIYSDTKKICNWIGGPILQELNAKKVPFDELNLKSETLITLIQKIDTNALSNLAAKDVLKFVLESGKSVDAIIQEKGLAQVSDEGELIGVVDAIIKDHAPIVDQIKSGKESAIGFLIGQAMKQTKGKANPKIIGDIFKRRIFNE